MALSLSESPTVPKPKETSSATRRTNSGSRPSAAAGDGECLGLFVHFLPSHVSLVVSLLYPSHVDWDDWDDESPPRASTRIAPAPVSAPAPAILPNNVTSLGTRQTSGAIRKPPQAKPKPQEDDIFASMGLAAKPTFTAPPTTSRPAPTTSSALAAAAEDVDVEADWGDDSDLDDLLDD